MKKILLLTCVFAMLLSCSEDKKEFSTEPVKETGQLTPVEIGVLHNKLVAAYFDEIKNDESKIKSLSIMDNNTLFNSIYSDVNEISKKYIKTNSTKSSIVCDFHPLNSTNEQIIEIYYNKGSISKYLYDELIKFNNIPVSDPLSYIKYDFAKNISEEEVVIKEIMVEVFLASYQYWKFEHDYSNTTKRLKMDDAYAICIADGIGSIFLTPLAGVAFSCAAIYASKQ